MLDSIVRRASKRDSVVRRASKRVSVVRRASKRVSVGRRASKRLIFLLKRTCAFASRPSIRCDFDSVIVTFNVVNICTYVFMNNRVTTKLPCQRTQFNHFDNDT